jgi:hypothetical protein
MLGSLDHTLKRRGTGLCRAVRGLFGNRRGFVTHALHDCLERIVHEIVHIRSGAECSPLCRAVETPQPVLQPGDLFFDVRDFVARIARF